MNRINSFALLLGWSIGFFAAFAMADDAEFMSRSEVAAALAEVIEPLAGRALTPAEATAVAEEFIPLLGDTECRARCVEAVRYNLNRIAPAIEKPGTPVAVRTRHDYISQLYFSPTQGGSLIQRLSAEADPILVVESAPQRLMTRSDVLASMNLFHFVRETGPPNAKGFSARDVAAAAETLNTVFGSAHHIMPRHLPLAAEFWRGLVLEWPNLTETERARVRTYFASQLRKPLTSDLYAKLLGLSPGEATTFYQLEYEDALFGIAARQFDVVAAIEEIRGYESLWLPR